MGMTIDKYAKMFIVKIECMKRVISGTDIDCNLFNCDKCSLCYEQGTMEEYEEALKFAVDIMHKYQKIEQIINNTDCIEEDVIKYKMICEVIEDGNND